MNAESTLAELRRAAAQPRSAWATTYQGHRPIATLCTYVPEELIHAAGFTAVRVWRKPRSSGEWGAHLQSFTCPLVRSLLEQGADGDLVDFAGVVFAHSCDAMQALADIWRLRFPDEFVWVVNHPMRLDCTHTSPYLLEEMRRFQAALEALSGTLITEERLLESIALHNRVRMLLAQLDGLRDRLSAEDFYAAVLAAQIMPKEDCAPLLESLVAALAQSPRRTVSVRVAVVGALLDDLTVPRLADELGIGIVGDDLCTGARYFEGTAPPDVPPLQALVARSLQRTPCPAKHRDTFHRGQALLKLARQRGAQGVVFYLQKFCEPHFFDYGQWQRYLQENGLPTLLLEDDAGSTSAQWRTRLQAFAEILAQEVVR